jgi:MFS family permease
LDRAKLIFVGAILSWIYAFIMLPLILENQTVISICIIISIHAAIFAIQDGTINVYGLEIFPVKYRYSCSAFFYSIGVGIIGGTSPMIATLITEHFANSVMLLGSYVATISLLAGVCVWLTRLKKLRQKV